MRTLLKKESQAYESTILSVCLAVCPAVITSNQLVDIL
jgi:hypothetical protein